MGLCCQQWKEATRLVIRWDMFERKLWFGDNLSVRNVGPWLHRSLLDDC